MRASANYRRVTAAAPCPVCGRADWCRESTDGGLVVCNRIQSSRPARGNGGGWLHDLGRARQFRTVQTPVRNSPQLSAAELELMDRRNRLALTLNRLQQLSARLGVSVNALRTLGVGWDLARSAYTFPMRDAAGRLIGIRTRRTDGRKLCVLGSRLGLIMPAAVLALLGKDDTDLPDSLLICEGESDAAAGFDLGMCAVARPGCEACGAITCELVRRVRPARLIIVADRDEAGQRGAHSLARRLAEGGIANRVLTLPNHKDLRAWTAATEYAAHQLAAMMDAPADRKVPR